MPVQQPILNLDPLTDRGLRVQFAVAAVVAMQQHHLAVEAAGTAGALPGTQLAGIVLSDAGAAGWLHLAVSHSYRVTMIQEWRLCKTPLLLLQECRRFVTAVASLRAVPHHRPADRNQQLGEGCVARVVVIAGSENC